WAVHTEPATRVESITGQLMIRDYRPADFSACRELVNLVWGFHARFRHVGLSRLLLEFYTRGALAASNYAKVIQRDGVVAGFIFARIETLPTPRFAWAAAVRVAVTAGRLIVLPGVRWTKKRALLRMARTHERNRATVDSGQASEVTLFVVHPTLQGEGWGRKLMDGVIAACRAVGASRLVLETDSESNWGFYRHVGFAEKGSFESPLLEEFTGHPGSSWVFEMPLS
ncbi:MAG: N-acetyltransferase family protein, partial [Spirochaetota bacterium]